MKKSYKVSALFTRLRDSEHRWEAHVLDLDVITYGDSLQHAVQMALEAARMVLEDDLMDEREPLHRRAPDADWTQFRKVQSGATTSGSSQLRTLGEVIVDPETEVSRSYVAVELWVSAAVTAAAQDSAPPPVEPSPANDEDPADPSAYDVDPAAYVECA